MINIIVVLLRFMLIAPCGYHTRKFFVFNKLMNDVPIDVRYFGVYTFNEIITQSFFNGIANILLIDSY